MKKRWITTVTLILLAGALVWLARRERLAGTNGSEPTAAGPEDVIWQMSDAAREGNAQTYLDCFTGNLQQNLKQTAAEMGDAQFSTYLKQLNNEVTGIAVSDLQQSAQEADLRVEFIFRGRNEAQKHHFKLIEGKWRIDRVDDAEQLKVLIPYGTTVSAAARK